MSLIGKIAGHLAGPVISGLFSARGADEANDKNVMLAREDRAWKERMSNTAYQRAALDLEKAGLNRILALGNPASTPAGTMPHPQRNVLGEGVAGAVSGLGVAKLSPEIDKIKSETGLKTAQTTVMGPLAELSGDVVKGYRSIREFLTGKLPDIVDFVSRLPEEIQDAATQVLQGLREAVSQGLDFTGNWLDTMGSEFNQAWQSLNYNLQNWRTGQNEH